MGGNPLADLGLRALKARPDAIVDHILLELRLKRLDPDRVLAHGAEVSPEPVGQLQLTDDPQPADA